MKIVSTKVIDDVLHTIFNSSATDSEGISKELGISESKVIAAIMILAHDKYADIITAEGVKGVAHVSLNATGIKFINDGGYTEAERIKKLNEDQASSVIIANRLTFINVAITILLTGVIVWLQFRADMREQNRDKREIRKEWQEEQQQLMQSRHDSLYENYLLRKAEEDVKSSSKQKDVAK